MVKEPVFVPTDRRVFGFIHDKGVEISPAENLLRINKTKISNCLGRRNEPFKLLIKINQSVIRLG